MHFHQLFFEMEEEELQFKKASSSRRRARVKSEEQEAADEGEAKGTTAVSGGLRQKKRGVMSSEMRADDAPLSVVYSGPVVTRDDVAAARDREDREEKEREEEEAKRRATGELQSVVGGEKVYTGEKSRANFFKTSEGAMKGTAGLKAGPIKASSFIKSATLIDYNPSVCKDYKQTGFCGYGQNCIYVHDRGDYKSGWEIDKEWAAKQKQGGAEEENYEVDSSDDGDNLPFACLICRKDFVDPVVTKCGHYFCESCALAQEKKTKRCAVCNEPTAGIFNQPKNLLEKIAKKKGK
jgi:RING finger protein 113A